MIAKKMYMGLLFSALFLFSMGFLAGYILNDSLKEIEDQSQSHARSENNGSTDSPGKLQNSSDTQKNADSSKAVARKSRSRKAEEEVEDIILSIEEEMKGAGTFLNHRRKVREEKDYQKEMEKWRSVSYTHLTLPTNREV